MKPVFTRFLSIALLWVVLLLPLRTHAQNTASLTGVTDVWAGDTVTLTFSIPGNGYLGVTCQLVYHDAQLTLQSVEALIPTPWIVESAGNTVLAYDNEFTAPINETTALFTATFKVKGTLEPGTEVKVTVDGIVASDLSTDDPIPAATWSAIIQQPRSSDATLSSLTAKNAPLTPEFSPAQLVYQATVPYSVRSLDFFIKPTHQAATYKISGNQLSVGSNEIRIRVTAEDGSSRTYTLYVTREQDPNYVPSADALLSHLKPSIGTLTPAFDPSVAEYALYLPYEVDTLTLSGTPHDSKGSAVDLTRALSEGLNDIPFVCIAEDGTTKTYTVRAVRMPPYSPEDGPILPPAQTEPPITTEPITTAPPPTSPVTTSPVTTAPKPTSPLSTAQNEPSATEPLASPAPTGGVPILLTVFIAIAALAVGFLAAALWIRSEEKHRGSFPF